SRALGSGTGCQPRTAPALTTAGAARPTRASWSPSRRSWHPRCRPAAAEFPTTASRTSSAALTLISAGTGRVAWRLDARVSRIAIGGAEAGQPAERAGVGHRAAPRAVSGSIVLNQEFRQYTDYAVDAGGHERATAGDHLEARSCAGEFC